MYDFTSLVGIHSGYGKIDIRNTNFGYFKNWASIVRDTKDFPETNQELNDYSTVNEKLLFGSRASILLQQINEVPVRWTSKECASLSIFGCIFTKFNYLKTSLGDFQPLLDSTSVMKYQGIILSLSAFYGDVAVINNIFDNLKFVFEHCNLANQDQNYFNSTVYNKIEVQQLKSLIRVEVHSNILIQTNTFVNCNSHSGLIHLERTEGVHAIIIKGNNFTQNSALSVTNGIRIDLATSISYTNSITDQMPCSGVLIGNLTFYSFVI